MLASAAVMCLALNVYYEARGEPPQGRMAVAQVAVRRAKAVAERDGVSDWEQVVCPAVYASRQFSWTTNMDRRGPRIPSSEESAWRDAVSVARQALLDGYLAHWPDFSKGGTHYHTHAVAPRWNRMMIKTASIGNHVFYKIWRKVE